MTGTPGTPQTNSLRFPDLGAVRVHPDPAALPRLRHEGPGRNRFDDPQGAFVVRYAAVRAALDASGLGSPLDPARLDIAIIRLGGRIGRPITQAVSRAVYEWRAGADGVGCRSRLDATERCWAIYDHVPVTVSAAGLDPADPEVRRAVQAVAARFEIPLPDPWA